LIYDRRVVTKPFLCQKTKRDLNFWDQDLGRKMAEGKEVISSKKEEVKKVMRA